MKIPDKNGMLYLFTSLYPVTLITMSTIRGENKENIFDTLFVRAIKVPACTGDKSMWLTLNPEYTAELNPTAIVNKNMAATGFLESMNVRHISEMAGMNIPGKNIQLVIAKISNLLQ